MKILRIVYFCFCLILLILVFWRYEVVESKVKNSELKKLNDLKKEITLIGTVVKEPDIGVNSTKLTIRVGKEKILAVVNRYPEYKYGDKLKITTQLESPPVFEEFNYQNYLKKEGIYSIANFPKIELIGQDFSLFTFFYFKILSFKDRVKEIIYERLPFFHGSVLSAMILGDKSGLLSDFKNKLSITGLSHIVAISGMHIAILTGILIPFLLGLGFWRSQAFYFVIILISFYIILIGFPSSAVRAAIMAGIFLFGQKIGRRSVSGRALFFSAGIMLTLNPLLLFYDIGFQLSFLATLGLIYLSPLFQNWLKFIPQEKFFNLREILSLTLSAQIFTLPILVYNFGRVSLVAPLTNILVLPIVPLLMISGFLFVIFGSIWSFFAWFFSFPCWFFLSYMIKIVEFFSQFSWAAKNIKDICWYWLFIPYVILFILILWFRKKERLKFLNY